MDKRERINEKVYKIPARLLNPLKRYLSETIRHYNRPDFEIVRESVLQREQDELNHGFCVLNEHGISMIILGNITLFAHSTWTVPAGATWEGFLQYMKAENYRLEIVPDPDERATETLQDA